LRRWSPSLRCCSTWRALPRRIALCWLLTCCFGAARAEDEAPEEPLEAAGQSGSSFADEPAALAPIGVVNGDTLMSGQWALSYRYEFIHQDDMRDGTHRDSSADVLTRFEETPRKRDTHVHLFGLAYAPHRRITLSAQLPVFVIETDATANVGGNFSTDTDGIGDLELRALVPFMRKKNETLQLEMGLSAPTGSTSRRGRDAVGDRRRLSFPQQLGSGTVDLLPGLVYRGHHESLSWGYVARGVFRVYDNSKDYRAGNEYEMSAWMARSWTDWMSTSLRMSWQRWENVNPDDRTFVNPEEDPKRQAGDRIELGPGVNFKLPFAIGPRFGVEMAWPLFQSLDGPQLERDWRLTAGWRWAF
jgi:hypothetical protein